MGDKLQIKNIFNTDGESLQTIIEILLKNYLESSN